MQDVMWHCFRIQALQNEEQMGSLQRITVGLQRHLPRDRPKSVSVLRWAKEIKTHPS